MRSYRKNLDQGIEHSNPSINVTVIIIPFTDDAI